MSTVLITGAGGLIARHLATVLVRDGHHVVGTTSGDTAIASFSRLHRCPLGESLEPALRNTDIDAIVHTANDAGPRAYDINVSGTTQWIEQATGHGVGLQIFLSSLSAEGADSDYGRSKRDLEGRFIDIGGVVFRLGLVIGNGGMFEKIKRSCRFPLLPLLDNGASPVYVLGIDFLCEVLRECIATNGAELRGRVWQVQQPRAHTLRDVLESTRIHFGYHCRFIPVPSWPILWGVTALERIGFTKLPISATNLKGLREGQRRTFTSDFDRFGHPQQSLDELIAAAAEAAAKS